MPLGLLALAVGGFGIGLTEFVIAGLLPEVARDFDVTETAAGWLISGYALSVAVGGVALTLAAARLPRKQVLLGLMVLFIIGNLLSAVGTTYTVMMIGRIVAALCHGAFFGIGAVVAASLVTKERAASAIALMFAGLTTANVLGVPLGTLLGQAYGWRSTFWAITVIGAFALVAIATLVPASVNDRAADNGGVRDASRPTGIRHELSAFANRQVWFSLLVTVLGFGGMFGAFTYIAFTLTEVSGFSSGAVPWLLVLFGVGTTVGNILGGRAANRSVPRTLISVLAILTVVMIGFALTAESQVLTMVSLVLMGAFGFATVPALQLRIMTYAGSAPTLASGANIAAFNVGNALGAWLGGVTIAAGLGYVSTIWAGAAMAAAALVTLLVAERVRS
ncbi:MULTISPECIES: MFS transporter [unclassified Knoellia]|uniref:MFS transporter n=1 Tax=Knoellia altitudinis TaxID=3404795 RepID=UPI003608C4CC